MSGTPEQDVYGSLGELTTSLGVMDETQRTPAEDEEEDGEWDREESRPLEPTMDGGVSGEPTGPGTGPGPAGDAPAEASCLPRGLRWIAGGPKVFALWSTLTLMVKVASGLYTGAVISTIEKQFKLSSTESGALMMVNDVMDLSLVLFVSYFGQSRHRPRIIGVGTAIVGLGLLTSVPAHLSLEPYTTAAAAGRHGCGAGPELGSNWTEGEAGTEVCSAAAAGPGPPGVGFGGGGGESEPPCPVEVGPGGSGSLNPVLWLVLGQMLVGIGNVPNKPLGTTYIDDAVGKHTTPLYIAFLFLATSGGSMLGVVLASVTLSIPVDFDRVAPWDQPSSDPRDPRFLGAWWLGFTVLGVLILLVSVPYFFFPRHLPKTKERLRQEAQERAEQLVAAVDTEEAAGKMEQFTMETEAEDHGKAGYSKMERAPSSAGLRKLLIDMFRNYKKLLTNSALVLLCLTTASSSAINAAVSSFGFKYYTAVLQMSDSQSPLLSLAIIPFLIGSNIIGGVIIRRWKFTPAQCALFLLLGSVVGVLCAPVFLTVGCDTVTLAGVSAPYREPAQYGRLPAIITESPALPDSVEEARALCNRNCSCRSLDYNPVCGSDGLTYVSPCYAGCRVVSEGEDSAKSFSECRCVGDGVMTAVDGECTSHCEPYAVPIIMVANIVQLFFGCLGASGMALITLRIVDESMRASALALQTLTLNLLGYLIAPVYFGALINRSCILWGYEEEERGACWVYDNDLFRLTFQGTIALLGLVCGVLLTGVYLLLRDPGRLRIKDADEKTP